MKNLYVILIAFTTLLTGCIEDKTITNEAILILGDITQIQAGESVLFESTRGSSFEWQFEGGDPAESSSSGEMVTYSNPGIYNVQVVVDGGAESQLLEDYIEVLPRRTITAREIQDFSIYNPEVGAVVGQVIAGDIEGNPLTFTVQDSEDFVIDSEGTLRVAEPLETSTIYELEIAVRNDVSTERIISTFVTVVGTSCEDLIPNFTAEKTVVNSGAGELLELKDQSSCTDIDSWLWEIYAVFPRGRQLITSSTQQNPVIDLNSLTENRPIKTFDIFLRVCIGNRCDEITKENYIEICQPLNASFISGTDELVGSGGRISLVSNSLGNPKIYQWELSGPYSENRIFTSEVSRKLVLIQLTREDRPQGTLDITLTVMDQCGNTRSQESTGIYELR